METLEVVLIVLNALFALSTIIAGGKYALVKRKVIQAAQLMRDIADAVEDNKLTADELKRIIRDLEVLLGYDLDVEAEEIVTQRIRQKLQ